MKWHHVGLSQKTPSSFLHSTRVSLLVIFIASGGISCPDDVPSNPRETSQSRFDKAVSSDVLADDCGAWGCGKFNVVSVFYRIFLMNLVQMQCTSLHSDHSQDPNNVWLHTFDYIKTASVCNPNLTLICNLSASPSPWHQFILWSQPYVSACCKLQGQWPTHSGGKKYLT